MSRPAARNARRALAATGVLAVALATAWHANPPARAVVARAPSPSAAPRVAEPVAARARQVPRPVAARHAPSAVPAVHALPHDLLRALESGALDWEDLAARVRLDPAFRATLQARYLDTRDADLRRTLVALLAEAPAGELVGFTERLLADADPERRADAYRLLAAAPLDEAAVRAQVLRGLGEERDAGALGTLLHELRPGLLATEDSAPIADLLLALPAHEDATVRASVLPQLPEWTEPAALEPVYANALADRADTVRAAAIAGIRVARLRTDALRRALFDVAADAEATEGLRAAALAALGEFRMSRADLARWRALEQEVPMHPGP